MKENPKTCCVKKGVLKSSWRELILSKEIISHKRKYSTVKYFWFLTHWGLVTPYNMVNIGLNYGLLLDGTNITLPYFPILTFEQKHLTQRCVVRTDTTCICLQQFPCGKGFSLDYPAGNVLDQWMISKNIFQITAGFSKVSWCLRLNYTGLFNSLGSSDAIQQHGCWSAQVMAW